METSRKSLILTGALMHQGAYALKTVVLGATFSHDGDGMSLSKPTTMNVEQLSHVDHRRNRLKSQGVKNNHWVKCSSSCI